jgi:CRP-like cAMP-binding protein
MQLDPSAFLADQELIQALDKQSTPISCGEGCVLFRQGDEPQGLYILHKGEAKLTMSTPTGETIMSFHAASGSLLGLPGLIGNQPYTLSAIACSGSQLSFVPRDEFANLMQSKPLLSLKVLQVLAAELCSARQALLQS